MLSWAYLWERWVLWLRTWTDTLICESLSQLLCMNVSCAVLQRLRCLVFTMRSTMGSRTSLCMAWISCSRSVLCMHMMWTRIIATVLPSFSSTYSSSFLSMVGWRGEGIVASHMYEMYSSNFLVKQPLLVGSVSSNGGRLMTLVLWTSTVRSLIESEV